MANKKPTIYSSAVRKLGKERICFVCRVRKTMPELIRIARINGTYIIDECGNANGRGCHICKPCIEKAIKTRSLNKSFKAKVPDEIYELLAKHSISVYNSKQEI